MEKFLYVPLCGKARNALIRRLASAFRLLDMYMKDIQRGFTLSYLSPRVHASSRRIYSLSPIDILSFFRFS